MQANSWKISLSPQYVLQDEADFLIDSGDCIKIGGRQQALPRFLVGSGALTGNKSAATGQ